MARLHSSANGGHQPQRVRRHPRCAGTHAILTKRAGIGTINLLDLKLLGDGEDGGRSMQDGDGTDAFLFPRGLHAR